MDSIYMEQLYSRLYHDVRKWLGMRGEQLKIVLADKIARILGLVLLSLSIGLLLLVGLVFFGIALAGWLGNYMPAACAYCTIGCVYLLLILILVLFRKALIVRPFISAMCSILLDTPDLSAANLPAKQAELAQRTAAEEAAIQQDVNNIQQQLNTPFSALSLLRKVPSIVRLVITILPFLRKLFRRK